MITTIEDATRELHEQAMDVAAENGDQTLQEVWVDLVNNVASDCTVEVAEELCRRQGVHKGARLDYSPPSR